LIISPCIQFYYCSRSKYPLGTKVAKHFHGQRYEGELLGYDALEDYYWILYDDGDSEQLDCAEMYQAVQEYDQEVNAMLCQLHLDTV
jgi:hypothetical protein